MAVHLADLPDALEHLGRDDDRPAGTDRSRDHSLLQNRHLRDVQFHPEIASSHQHRIAGLDHVVQMSDRPGPFDLGHESRRLTI